MRIFDLEEKKKGRKERKGEKKLVVSEEVFYGDLDFWKVTVNGFSRTF